PPSPREHRVRPSHAKRGRRWHGSPVSPSPLPDKDKSERVSRFRLVPTLYLVPTLSVGMPAGTPCVPAACHAAARLPAAPPSVAPGIPTPSVGTRGQPTPSARPP